MDLTESVNETAMIRNWYTRIEYIVQDTKRENRAL